MLRNSSSGLEISRILRILEMLLWKPMKDLLTFDLIFVQNMEMWEHGELAQLDVRGSGETRALCYLKGYLYSGHTDATIKVLIVFQFRSVFLALKYNYV